MKEVGPAAGAGPWRSGGLPAVRTAASARRVCGVWFECTVDVQSVVQSMGGLAERVVQTRQAAPRARCRESTVARGYIMLALDYG